MRSSVGISTGSGTLRLAPYHARLVALSVCRVGRGYDYGTDANDRKHIRSAQLHEGLQGLGYTAPR